MRTFLPDFGGLSRLPVIVIQSLAVAVIDFFALSAGMFAVRPLPPGLHMAAGIIIAGALCIGAVITVLTKPVLSPRFMPSGRNEFARIYLGALVWNPFLHIGLPGLFIGPGDTNAILHTAFFQLPVNFIAIQIALFRSGADTPPSENSHPHPPEPDPDRYTRPYRPSRKKGSRPL